jgi:spore coat protein A, manganese oxidase
MPITVKLHKFVDALPIPSTIQPKQRNQNFTYYEVTMREFTQKLHRDLQPTRLWGYDGMYPGPTFDVMQYERVYVKWINDLPEKHFLPVDTTIHGSEITLPEGRTVVHLHGATTPPDSDGYPEAWFTRNFEQTGPLFQREIYEYPNIDRATTLWYHDHTIGITRLNNYAGLAGFYLIRDWHEQSLNLPKGKYETPLVIQDRSFNQDGSLYYPSCPDNTDKCVPYPSLVSPFDADTILVNGKVWPYMEVEPRKYRLRILNASNSRWLTLKLDSGEPLYQIGSDGGFLEKTAPMNEIILGSAERADVIVDFSRNSGQTIILKNVTKTASPETTEVMQFRVTVPLSNMDTSSLPVYLAKINRLTSNMAKRTRDLPLIRLKDQYGRSLNLLDGKMWIDRISEVIEVDTVEIWRLINLINDDPHPIHIHLVDFQVLGRQPFDVAQYQKSGTLIFTGAEAPPDLNEMGLKDTVRTPFGFVTSIIARFGPYSGRYVWHCHMLEHEDYEMMRPIEIIPRV